jgi:hypothetical protein
MSNLAAGEGDEEDTGVYAESYKNATWIYIGDSEEMHVWQKPETKGEDRGEKTFILSFPNEILVPLPMRPSGLDQQQNTHIQEVSRSTQISWLRCFRVLLCTSKQVVG